MSERHVKIWYDSENDFLEVIFDSKPGHFRETSNDHVMEKVDERAEAGALGWPARRSSGLIAAERRLARPARIELAAPRLGGGCSIP